MTKIKPLLLAIALLAILIRCEKQFDPYERPVWLEGKLYSEILEEENLSTFAKCLELTGYDTIINVSGSYTVFAPTNEAWSLYFSENGSYNSVEDIPVSKLSSIVKYHIVQNPWSKRQLRTLDVYGWIDTLDLTNNEPKGFKRETILLEKNRKYGIKYIGSGVNSSVTIVDTTSSDFNRLEIKDSRKYAPIFFQEYFDIYDLDKSDYAFYFNRSFDSSDDIYFVGAKIVSDEIFAENGFIYAVDRVVEPLESSYQILDKKDGNYQYTDFLSLLNRFPQFTYNENATQDQPGAELGIQVDSLFNLTYPDLVFDINAEKTTAPRGTYLPVQNVTIRYHHGLMAPTNGAFQDFIDNYIEIDLGWQTLDNTPDNIKEIITGTYMSYSPIYQTNIEEGFYNGQQDIVHLNQDNIAEKKFGSNATFIGLNEALIPRAFSSVTGPVYLRQGYRKIMFMIERAKLLSALKRENKDYSFFVESDAKTDIDSSLFFNRSTSGVYNFYGYEVIPGPLPDERWAFGLTDIRNLILNHVATRTPVGVATKEFIPTLSGNYLIFDNETGAVSGTAQTTVGFRGVESKENYPVKINFDTDNGNTYDIDNWFSFSTSNLYSIISTGYPAFHDLMNQAGLAREKEYLYTFISGNESYTVFAPSDEAIANEDFSGMTNEELRNFCLLHFVRGAIIFTDGSASAGYYNTQRVDESSTEFSTFNTKLYIEPGYDVIKLKAANGFDDVEIVLSETANQMAGITVDDPNIDELFATSYNNAVIHEIDQVLKLEELDTK